MTYEPPYQPRPIRSVAAGIIGTIAIVLSLATLPRPVQADPVILAQPFVQLNSHLMFLFAEIPVLQNLSPAERTRLITVVNSRQTADIYRAAFDIALDHHADFDAANVALEEARDIQDPHTVGFPSGIRPSEVVEALQRYHQSRGPATSLEVSTLGPRTPQVRGLMSAIQMLSPLLQSRNMNLASATTCLFHCGRYVDLLRAGLTTIGIDAQEVHIEEHDHISLRIGNLIIDPTIQQVIDHPDIRGILIADATHLAQFATSRPERMWHGLFPAYRRNRGVESNDPWALVNRRLLSDGKNTSNL